MQILIQRAQKYYRSMTIAVDVDHRWRRVLARALHALDISVIFLVRGEFERDHHGCFLSRKRITNKCRFSKD